MVIMEICVPYSMLSVFLLTLYSCYVVPFQLGSVFVISASADIFDSVSHFRYSNDPAGNYNWDNCYCMGCKRNKIQETRYKEFPISNIQYSIFLFSLSFAFFLGHTFSCRCDDKY